MKLVKTTVTLPEEMLKQAKFTAINENTTLSELMRDGLRLRISSPPKSRKKLDPMKTLGVFKLGIKEPYKQRSDLYDDYLKRKMGF